MKKRILLAILFLPSLGFALTTWVGPTWVGPSTITIAAWNTASNWSQSSVPGTSVGLIFNTAVTITENVPITNANSIKVSSPGSLTISSGVSIPSSDVIIDGGSIVNNGTFTPNNVTYTNAGGTITNNGTFNANNLNTGNSTFAGTFINNGSLNVTKNIIVEEGNFTNNAGATIQSNGITVQNGGTINNNGTITSSGASNTGQVIISSGGTFNNNAGGILNVALTTSNVYALKNAGTFNNSGTTFIGTNPVNPGSAGILNETSGIFSNPGVLIFKIDPANCVLTNNNNTAAEFSTNPISILSGSNCLNTPTTTTLPIKLISFTGTSFNNTNTLKWVVTNELSGSYYQLEKTISLNNKWQTVKTILANVNQLTEKNYQFEESVTEGFYYRLKLIDNNSYSYSNIIYIPVRKSNEKNVFIFPIPANQTLTVSGLNVSQGYSYKIINTSGTTVKQINNATSNVINLNNIVNGMYQLVIFDKTGNSIEKLKFIKSN